MMKTKGAGCLGQPFHRFRTHAFKTRVWDHRSYTFKPPTYYSATDGQRAMHAIALFQYLTKGCDGWAFPNFGLCCVDVEGLHEK